MHTFELHRGTLPLLVSLPHNGTDIPDDIRAALVEEAQSAPDTDWHVDRLYDFALALGASVLKPRYSRYVIDLNRPPDDASLYPGQNVTGLCPTVAFSGRPIYRDGQSPDAEAIVQRRAQYWQPYHTALQAELHRLKQQHGRVLLWEGHSIRPELPYLFEGRLPDFNLGTAEGRSFPDARLREVEAVLAAQSEYSWVSNGRFKGGYITRHYAAPGAGIHAFQLELAQSTYLDGTMTAFDAPRAAPVQALIARMMAAALHLPE
ncbi:MAG: N-formylglutamate deformylase [Arenimonas sp.]|uniref:N-formylglutamate deformylase n=1 Tax=Arenimonas sp. TaxID=1872635 RepID=UPI003C06428E